MPDEIENETTEVQDFNFPQPSTTNNYAAFGPPERTDDLLREIALHAALQWATDRNLPAGEVVDAAKEFVTFLKGDSE